MFYATTNIRGRHRISICSSLIPSYLDKVEFPIVYQIFPSYNPPSTSRFYDNVVPLVNSPRNPFGVSRNPSLQGLTFLGPSSSQLPTGYVSQPCRACLSSEEPMNINMVYGGVLGISLIFGSDSSLAHETGPAGVVRMKGISTLSNYTKIAVRLFIPSSGFIRTTLEEI